MEQITLYYRLGSSDKMYQASIQPADGGFTVPFAFGRRGTTLQAGSKTKLPVPYEEAKEIFDRLVAEKEAKGYTPGPDGTPYQQTPRKIQSTGILPQLLNEIDDTEVESLIKHPHWWMQEKFDGKRLLLQKDGAEVFGINRRGLRVALPESLAKEAAKLPGDLILDGEAIGDQLHVFDVLLIDGEDVQPMPYLERFLRLMKLLSAPVLRHLRLVRNACTHEEKQKLFNELRKRNAEGVVFKDLTQPYTAGRPDHGGAALKFKFHETGSFVVGRINEKRSVLLMLFDGEKVKQAGNVTIPANHEIPALGAVVEVRYLYAFPEFGSIYQPVYLGVREDIGSEECTVEQLKFKVSTPEELSLPVL